MDGVTSSSVETLRDQLFAHRCGCCPGIPGVLRAGPIEMPDRVTPETGELCGTALLAIDFPGGLDITGAGAIGVYLRAYEGGTITPSMVGQTALQSEATRFSWDPLPTREQLGLLLGLLDVDRVDRIELAFAGAGCVELLGYTLFGSDQVRPGDLLVDSRLIHDAGPDAAAWRASTLLGPVGRVQIGEHPDAVDGATSLAATGPIERDFDPPLDLSGDRLLRVWVWGDGELVLRIEDGAVHTFAPISLTGGWQQLTYDLAAAGIQRIARLAIGTRGAFRLDTIHAGNPVDAEARTRELLGLPAAPAGLLQPLDRWRLVDPRSADLAVDGQALRVQALDRSGGRIELAGDIQLDLTGATALVMRVRGEHVVPGDTVTLLLADGAPFSSAVFPPQPYPLRPGSHALRFDLAGLIGRVDRSRIRLVQPTFAVQPGRPGGGGPAPAFWIDHIGIT